MKDPGGGRDTRDNISSRPSVTLDKDNSDAKVDRIEKRNITSRTSK